MPDKLPVNNTDAINIIKALADKEISLCTSEEQLCKVDKFWKKYFAEVNRFIAGKREEAPYVADDGKTII